jgi:phospholipid transport system transporter-binding protein
MANYKPSSNLSFETVEQERTKLIQFIEDKDNASIRLDLSELNQCDSAGLALIFDIQKICKKLGKEMSIEQMPMDTKNLAAFYGVQNLLKNS